ncbi:dihydrofolate reductase family protein [Actinomadura luteofluorescens]|uniref:dihydrofolate reductase family protein n=1 Tax=Actinomadura luteofluorescens TaxID=46163 RepID=UPI003634492D
MTGQNAHRTVTANITLSLDGRVNGPGGEYDMSWIVPHAMTSASRDHMVAVTGTATTALLGRKNFEGFAGFWPAVADDDSADPRDREFSRWLNAVEKVVFSGTLTEAAWDNARLAAPTRSRRSSDCASRRAATSSCWPVPA